MFSGQAQAPAAIFSAFNHEHVALAMRVVANFMEIANNGAPEEALDAVLDAYDARRGTANPDLLDYALIVFITHHPIGTALTHAIPPMTLRSPEFVAPSRTPEERRAGMFLARAMGLPIGAAAVGEPTPFAGGALPTDDLEWYREDPFANEHHEHWHVVYPVRGVPNPANPSQIVFKDRQGEVFFYMHQQMLARYDAERVALGLPRVVPLANYRSAIAIGYDPGSVFAQQGFSARQPGATMTDIPPVNGQPAYTVGQHETVRDHINQALAARAYTFFQPPLLMTDVSLLGSTVEANGAGIGSSPVPGAGLFYGSLHNAGHGLISQASATGTGVMTTPRTAIRDPVFYEWHKHVDDFYAAWQDGAGVQTFDDRPPVRLRKGFQGSATSPDIMFLFEEALPAGALQNLDTWAGNTFGGPHWDTDFTGVAPTTDVLETTMTRRRMTLADRLTNVPIDHLTHRPFFYVFRIENRAQAAAMVTARVFIAPITGAAVTGSEDRRTWIEMDKFVVQLAPGERKVAARRGGQSAVIRKPATMVPPLLKELGVSFTAQQLTAMRNAGLPAALAAKLEPRVGQDVGVSVLFAVLGEADFDTAAPFLNQFGTILPSEQPARPSQNDTGADIQQQEAFNYCTCGWPFNLLLPRGTPQGMSFRIVVVCSDWQIDRVGGEESCGSMSFCGARASYPDRRPMGYPFNARFADSITDTVMANANMAFGDFTIRRMPDVDTDD